jgi:hypothetical protein
MKKLLSVVSVSCAIMAFAQLGFAQVQKMGNNIEKPGAIVVEAVTSTATADTVDYEKRTGTLKLADGTIATFSFGPEVRTFDQVNVGDHVLLKGTPER